MDNQRQIYFPQKEPGELSQNILKKDNSPSNTLIDDFLKYQKSINDKLSSIEHLISPVSSLEELYNEKQLKLEEIYSEKKNRLDKRFNEYKKKIKSEEENLKLEVEKSYGQIKKEKAENIQSLKNQLSELESEIDIKTKELETLDEQIVKNKQNSMFRKTADFLLSAGLVAFFILVVLAVLTLFGNIFGGILAYIGDFINNII